MISVGGQEITIKHDKEFRKIGRSTMKKFYFYIEIEHGMMKNLGKTKFVKIKSNKK